MVFRNLYIVINQRTGLPMQMALESRRNCSQQWLPPSLLTVPSFYLFSLLVGVVEHKLIDIHGSYVGLDLGSMFTILSSKCILVWTFSSFCGAMQYETWASQVVLVVKNLPANAKDTKRCGLDTCIRKLPWSRNWQPTPALVSGKSHGQRSHVV